MECKEFKTVNLKNVKIDVKLLEKIPEEIARENCMILFKKVENTLYAAVNEIPELHVVEKMKFILKQDIIFFKSDKKYILRIIDNYYCDEAMDYVKNNFKISDNDFRDNNNELEESPVVKTTNRIIDRAIENGASDIHIEPFEFSVNIRFRIDGILHEYVKMPRQMYTPIRTRIKIMSDMDIAEKRMPQDGKISYIKDSDSYNIRASSIPTIYGEKFVLRILYKNKNMMELSNLGFLKKDEIKIRNMLRISSGIILTVGPTGSGKSTTMYSLISNLNRYEKNIVSIEDPVEYTIEGINQINVNNKINFGFAKALRSILRQDPDVIMIGEIRDEETANIAVRAAITGHLVISTLHTNNSYEAILRLENMGIPMHFIKDALVGVISQRLVRKICLHCSGKGCEKCNYTGYMGRTVVYQIDSIKNRDENKISIKENAFNLVEKGITDHSEISRLNLQL